MKLCRKKLALATMLVLQQWPAHQAGAQQLSKLDEITVTSTRGTSGDISRAAATVSVITAEEMEQQNAKDIKDALRYEPGVEVRRAVNRTSGISGASATAGRGGNEGITIRGLDGNRVLLLEDGIPVPRAFSVGTLSAGRGSYLDTDLYQRIEVLRGPASSMYGSDGLTGAVNFVIKDPQDYLNIFNKNTYFALRPSYDSVDNSYGTSGTFAIGGERWQGMLLLNTRHGKETDNKGERDVIGSTRTTPDPSTYDTQSALGRVVFRATAQDVFKLTLATTENKTSTNSLSALGPASVGTVSGYQTTSNVQSDRVSLAYERDDAENTAIQKIRANLFYRDAKTNQYTFESGTGSGRPRFRNVTYEDTAIGGGVMAESRFDLGSVRNQLVYGVDVSRSTLSQQASGTGWTVCTGTQYCELFPKTNYSIFGAYVQDDMRFGKLSVIPGLRYDAYELNPQASARYDAQANANGQPASRSKDNALSPRLAFVYEVTPALVPYAQYARGFRAPSPHEVNSYFNNVGTPNQSYMQIANPNLKAETSNSFEIGLRGKMDFVDSRVRYSAAAFAGKYKNFIELVQIGGNFSVATPAINQYINASRANIHGVEGRVDWRWNAGWTVRGGFAYTQGDSINRNGVKAGLDSISPLSVVAGLRYEKNQTWFVQGDVLYNTGKKRSDLASQTVTVSNQAQPAFVPSSFAILDLSSGYRFSKNVSLNVGVRNLFDRKYWVWNDVRGLGLAGNAGNLDAYTSPGRSLNASLKIEY
ncbi:TonB-dependent hemoglobin/transferrin/lactoferrin family receptor [Herminiimonas arsenitoxidans]|uniref:TonB-dependent hemoglobin/transferrin/lactoferrin family receptor n=1 Tax=Herminiimonas arsenitoxidans TaxID=1809410 RepID=UPI0009709614|nr:TonB-dependent hemoglobin/transferrin/lactoferrin family receptor [Herminiimonas arsenitoxidans]